MEKQYITFGRIDYECREIEYQGDTYTVAEIALAAAIFGDTVSKEAESLDETICYYADKEEMALSDKELIKKIFG